jgi:FkbM family methyltransferase
MSDVLGAASPEPPGLVVALTRTDRDSLSFDSLEALARMARDRGGPCLSAPEAAGDAVDAAAWATTTVDRLLGSAPERDVVLVTDDARIAALGEQPGCLPVLLASPGAGWPVDRGLLRTADPGVLAPIFANRPSALLHLLRTAENEIRATHERAAARFRESLASGGGLFVFGSGTVGRQMVRALRGGGVQPSGLLDNNVQRHGSVIDGLTVRPPGAVNVDRDVIVVAVGMAAAAIEAQLDDQGVKHSFNMSEVLFALGSQLERDLARQVIDDRLDYAWLYTQLTDERSRECLEAVIRHRLTLDTGHLAGVCVRHEPQWFDRDVIPDHDAHVFVDGGAFDGDSLTAFIARFHNRYVHAYGFEPDPELAARAARRFAAETRITVAPKGLSDRAGSVPFSVTGATDGSVGDALGMTAAPASGERRGSSVDVVRLDDEVLEPVSFLKLDVEGAELPALRGALGHIVGSRPTLAVAVYHRASDLRDVPQFIVDHRSGDRLYLRHYTDVSFETVLYAVPDAPTGRDDS